MRRIILLFLLVIATISCSTSEEINGKPLLSGTFQNASGKTVLFEKLTPTSVIPLDTFEIDDNGNYELKTRIEEPGFYRVFASKENFVILVLDSNSRVKLNADLNNFSSTYMLEGSPESSSLQELYAVMRKHDMTRDSIQTVFQSKINQPDIELIRQSLSAELEKSEAARSEYLKNFADKNASSLVSLIAISSIQYEQHPEVFKKVADELSVKYPGSPLVEPFLSSYRELQRTAKGEMAPEIIMPDQSGESFALSSLKGKYVLVDFWASWCKPCREENPNVVRIYDKYKNKGFEILGVSLDRDKDAWLKAISDDKLTWKHISDLAFWNSSVVKSYGISGIPYTVLLDKEGRIMEKGLRGATLELKLKEIFGE